MGFSFSSTSGNSGQTSIVLSATNRSETTDLVSSYTLSNASGLTLPMTVAQRGAKPVEKYIQFKPTTFSFPASGGNTTLQVTSNDNWSVNLGDWIRPNTISGNGNYLIGIRVGENTGNTRNYTITGVCLSDTAKTASASVSQEGAYQKPYLNVNPPTMSVNASGGTGLTFAVTSNREWTVERDNSRWLTLTTVSGSNDGTVYFNVAENPTNFDRNGVITVVSSADSMAATCRIQQIAIPRGEPYLIVSPSTQNVGTIGGTFTITVSANTQWETEVVYGEGRGWISLDKLNGDGDDEVLVRVEPNNEEGSTGRTAYISFFNNKESLKTEVNIEQYNECKSITYSTTGGTTLNPYNTTGWGATIISNTYDTVQDKGTIIFDDNITLIPDNAFAGRRQLKTIDIPNVVTIGIQAFEYCSGLTGSLIIPNSVTVIGGAAFRGCVNLNSLTIGNSVVTLDGFAGCTGLTGNLIIPNSVTTIGGFNLCYGLTGDLILPNVTTITNRAFQDCSGFTGNLIANSAVTIGDFAFRYCNFTGSLSLPSVKTIGEEAFLGCSRFTGSLSLPNVVTIGEDAFKNCSGFTGSLSLPNVETIDKGAFENCSGFTGSLSLPSVETINNSAFKNCRFTGDLNLPSVKTIGYQAFLGCSRFTGSLSLPNVVTIENNAFTYCSGFTSVTFGDSISTIKSNAFTSCSGLTSIYSYSLTCPSFTDWRTFNGVSINGTLHYPSGSDYTEFINILPNTWTAIADL